MKKSIKFSPKFSPEFRARAVRMVAESRADHPSLWSAVESIAAKIGCTPQTLLTWVRQLERDSGQREGQTTADHKRVKELEREVKELHKANEILKLASTFFAQAERWPRESGHPAKWISASIGDGNRLPRSRSNEKSPSKPHSRLQGQSGNCRPQGR